MQKVNISFTNTLKDNKQYFYATFCHTPGSIGQCLTILASTLASQKNAFLEEFKNAHFFNFSNLAEKLFFAKSLSVLFILNSKNNSFSVFSFNTFNTKKKYD